MYKILSLCIVVLYSTHFTIGHADPHEDYESPVNFDLNIGDKQPKLTMDIYAGDNDRSEDYHMVDARRRHKHGKKHHKHPKKSALRIKNSYPITGSLISSGINSTDTNNFPYMAAIIIHGRLWCAGAIVDVNWVITAAHCLNYVLNVSPLKSLGKFVKIRVGSMQAHEGGQVVDVVGAVRHPKFEEEPVPHADVALLKLAENLEFSEQVNLIKIYESMKEPFSHSFVVISGWGATSGSVTAFKDNSPDLLTARLKVRTQHYCIDAYQLVNGFQFTNDFFCASLRNGTRDACLFDAGAPAVQQNKLMGIMTFGPERCGHEYQPAVFIKAFYFRDFVKHTISSYKTTAELMDAMREVDTRINPPLQLVTAPDGGAGVVPGNDIKNQLAKEMDMYTKPDYLHD